MEIAVDPLDGTTLISQASTSIRSCTQLCQPLPGAGVWPLQHRASEGHAAINNQPHNLVDPNAGLHLQGRNGAVSVIALAERGALFDPGPCMYMEKLAVGPEVNPHMVLAASCSCFAD